MANGDPQNPMAPIFQVVQPQKKAPMGEQIALMLQQRAQESPLFEGQREDIAENKELLANLKAKMAKKPDKKMGVLAALTDIVSGTGNQFSKLYKESQPKDQTKELIALKTLIRAQNQGLTDDQLKFMQNQMVGMNQAGGLDQELKAARLKAEQAKTKKLEDEKKTQSESLQNVGKILVRDIGMAKDLIDKGGAAVTTWGAPMSLIPGTDADVLRKHIDSVKGNVAVDQLLNIKRQGSGLGQVPQSQLDMLSTLMGSLKPTLPPETLRQNLQDIEDIYSDIVRKEGGDPLELYNKRIGKEPAKKTAPKPPSVGTEKDGYRFKGGDPKMQSSWEKM